MIWSGDPFEPLTRAERVLVRGVDVHRPSRQDELMQRYKTLPPTYRNRPEAGTQKSKVRTQKAERAARPVLPVLLSDFCPLTTLLDGR